MMVIHPGGTMLSKSIAIDRLTRANGRPKGGSFGPMGVRLGVGPEGRSAGPPGPRAPVSASAHYFPRADSEKRPDCESFGREDVSVTSHVTG